MVPSSAHQTTIRPNTVRVGKYKRIAVPSSAHQTTISSHIVRVGKYKRIAVPSSAHQATISSHTVRVGKYKRIAVPSSAHQATISSHIVRVGKYKRIMPTSQAHHQSKSKIQNELTFSRLPEYNAGGRVMKGKIMPTEDQYTESPSSADAGWDRSKDLTEQVDYRSPAGRRPNAFGCLLLLTGVLFTILAVLGLRAYARIATVDIWSLAMIGFVGVLAVAQLIVGVWMLRGSRAESNQL